MSTIITPERVAIGFATRYQKVAAALYQESFIHRHIGNRREAARSAGQAAAYARLARQVMHTEEPRS